MKLIKGIKLINKLNITKEEKRRFIILGTLETFINSYKMILKLPFLLIICIFIIIGTVFEKITELFDIILIPFDPIINKIDKLKTIELCKQEDKDKLYQQIKELYKPVQLDSNSIKNPNK